MTYLNQAGTSWPKPEPVHAAVSAALQAEPREWGRRFEAVHQSIADFFGVLAPEQILPCPGCTSALAGAVADHPWAPGDRILISGHEHLALERPALALRDRGVEVIVAPSGGGRSIDLDFVQERLREGGVRLVAFSAASNVTGELAPLEALVNLAHEHGALCLVDGAQVAGWLPVDLPKLGADLFAFAGHKGLHGPWGIGGLYIAPGTPMQTPRLLRPNPAPGYCDVGSVDRSALAGLGAALAWLGAPEREDRLARARARAKLLWDGLSGWPEVTLYGPADPELRMPTVALTVEGIAASELAGRLADRGVITSGGLQCAPLAHRTLGTEGQGVLRCSFGPGNRDEDVRRALDGLRAVI